MLNSIRPQDSSESQTVDTENQQQIDDSKPSLEQITLRSVNSDFSASGNASRTYDRFDGFKLTISAVLPSLPSEVRYEAYYTGVRGTIRLGRMVREVSTYMVEYSTFADQRNGYDKVEIRVEGAEGTVEGITVPFTAAEGIFASQ